jgi:hypothetical protein
VISHERRADCGELMSVLGVTSLGQEFCTEGKPSGEEGKRLGKKEMRGGKQRTGGLRFAAPLFEFCAGQPSTQSTFTIARLLRGTLSTPEPCAGFVHLVLLSEVASVQVHDLDVGHPARERGRASEKRLKVEGWILVSAKGDLGPKRQAGIDGRVGEGALCAVYRLAGGRSVATTEVGLDLRPIGEQEGRGVEF